MRRLALLLLLLSSAAFAGSASALRPPPQVQSVSGKAFFVGDRRFDQGTGGDEHWGCYFFNAGGTFEAYLLPLRGLGPQIVFVGSWTESSYEEDYGLWTLEATSFDGETELQLAGGQVKTPRSGHGWPWPDGVEIASGILAVGSDSDGVDYKLAGVEIPREEIVTLCAYFVFPRQ